MKQARAHWVQDARRAGLTLGEIAARLQVSQSTVQNIIAEYQLPVRGPRKIKVKSMIRLLEIRTGRITPLLEGMPEAHVNALLDRVQREGTTVAEYLLNFWAQHHD